MVGNTSETKKQQYSSSVKSSSVGTSNQNTREIIIPHNVVNAQGNNLVTIQGIISMKQGGIGESLRQQRQEEGGKQKSKTPARESAMQKSRNTGPRY